MNSLNVRLWNVKGIKLPRKRKAFLNEAKAIKELGFWVRAPLGFQKPKEANIEKEVNQFSNKEKEEMDRVSYTSAVGSLMHAMVCTWPNITHLIGVVSRFLSNSEKEH